MDTVKHTAETAITAAGVFKGAEGLRGLAESDVYWEQRPYGTRLYYGTGIADYLHRDVLRAAVRILDKLPVASAAEATPPVSGWSDKPVTRAELLPRIDSAIKRITSGSGSMRVPPDNDDPDLVLADCKKLLQAPALPKDPPPGLLMSMAMRYDHGLGMPGYYDAWAQFGLGHGITHAQRLDGTLRIMNQLYEEVSGNGFYKPELEESYAKRAAESGAAPALTHEDLQREVHAAAARLIELATERGVVVTIEHRRRPDASPAQYVIETRATRPVYTAQMAAAAAAKAKAEAEAA